MEDGPPGGVRLAVKDLIDVAGVPTTAGSRAVSDDALPAAADAACLAGARAAGARVVGKANLFELAYGASGLNEWFGTPVNPLDPGRVPGGSSSGSAVSVATGEADVAFGSDTGGSIRVPSAFCGTAGLKTTHGRVSLDGVWPLAPSLDTVGPMGRDVAAVELGMALLEPGFDTTGVSPARTVARVRVPGLPVDELIDAAIDAALRRTDLQVEEVEVADWDDASAATVAILDFEAVRSNIRLTANAELRAKLGPTVAGRLEAATAVTASDLSAALEFQAGWRRRLSALVERFQLLACPTVPFFAPRLGEASGVRYTALTNPVNLAGLPALSLPVPSGGPLPAGLQLIGPAAGEELLLATARAFGSL